MAGVIPNLHTTLRYSSDPSWSGSIGRINVSSVINDFMFTSGTPTFVQIYHCVIVLQAALLSEPPYAGTPE